MRIQERKEDKMRKEREREREEAIEVNEEYTAVKERKKE